MADKKGPRSEVDTLVSSKNVFNDFQERMGQWMSDNYGRILDVFRRFDVDNSGRLSYDEFKAGMRDLGAPATDLEIYLIAMALDADGDKEIDYSEFKKLRRKFKMGAVSLNKAADPRSAEVESPVPLQPCPNCNVGLWEPVVDEVSGYIMLDLRSTAFQNLPAFPDNISAQVPSSISIYGITQIVRKELGPCTLNVRIYQPTGRGTREEMAPEKKLKDFGFVGSLPPDEPAKVTLLYDYDYPLLDDPLLMANFSV